VAVSGEINVHFDDVEGAAIAVRGVGANIDGLLADLRTMLRPIAAEWTGAAAVNYQYQQHVWNLAAEDLHATLLRIAEVLANSHGSYVEAESALQNLWGES
jgi:early secretory antigenic target protein ESAT-6